MHGMKIEDFQRTLLPNVIERTKDNAIGPSFSFKNFKAKRYTSGGTFHLFSRQTKLFCNVRPCNLNLRFEQILIDFKRRWDEMQRTEE